MTILYLLLSMLPGPVAFPPCASCGFRLQAESLPQAESRVEDPDALYRQRDTLAAAQQAERIWAARLAANAKDFESAWKLARARYWLGTHGPEKSRKDTLEGGIA